MRLSGVGCAVVVVAACSSAPECTSPDEKLTIDIRCADGEVVVDVVARLAGRPVSGPERRTLLGAIRDRSISSADAKAWLAELQSLNESLSVATGLPAVEARATAAWQTQHGIGPIAALGEPAVRATQRSLGIWSSSDTERLVLVETDIEGMLRFASLCREIQGGQALSLSLGARQQGYRQIVERFEAADRLGKLHQIAIGAAWPMVRERWTTASFEQQQKFIEHLPLPPPMTTDSAGYVTVALQLDSQRQLSAIEEVFSPLTLGRW